MKILKVLVVLLTLFACSVFVYGYLNETEVLDTIINYYERKPSILIYNEYTKDDDVSFVKLTNDFVADSKEELLNIYYTVLSSGMSEFTFYCSKTYTECTKDVISINDNVDLLSQMNNFINVYNSFKSIKTTYTTRGKITLSINRIYSIDDINLIKTKLEEIEKTLYDGVNSDYDKIRRIHDYVVNNTKYNTKDENIPNTPSSNALGVLIYGLATCNGYTDTISLLLDRLNIKNLRISNDDHIWNLIYLNGRWLHLDATWDDPVNNLNKDIITHDYFLKTTQEYENLNNTKPDNKHIFDKQIYNFAV